MYNYILFDLDGTLTDPAEGITNSAAYALEKLGIINTDRTELYPFIGPPLYDSFREFCGLSHEDATKAVSFYRENFREKGIFENKVYDGIPEVLKALKAAGCKLSLATSKPDIFAEKILDHFDLLKYFDFIAASTLAGDRGTKADVVRYALEQLKVEDLSEALMVGDRKFDIEGAKECGIDSVGVIFGYGGREELAVAGATFLAEKPDDILRIVQSHGED